MKINFVLALVLIVFFSCSSPTSNYKELKLISYGMPITIKAPENAVVQADDWGIWKDITVKAGDDYFVQIISSEGTSLDVDKILKEKRKEVEDMQFFSKIIQEDKAGFIFEKKIDENTLDYDFVYIKIQGDHEYSFQTGLFGMFTEEQVKNMYKSVQ